MPFLFNYILNINKQKAFHLLRGSVTILGGPLRALRVLTASKQRAAAASVLFFEMWAEREKELLLG